MIRFRGDVVLSGMVLIGVTTPSMSGWHIAKDGNVLVKSKYESVSFQQKFDVRHATKAFESKRMI